MVARLAQYLIPCVLLLSTTASAGSYKTPESFNLELQGIAQENPLAYYEKLGESERGQDIGLLVFTKSRQKPKPAVYLNGTHHGNEKASTVAVMAVSQFFHAMSKKPLVQRILNHYDIYLQPLVNPDGYIANSRYNAKGHDLNRDYPDPERLAGGFRNRETRLVGNLMKRVPIRASISFHSGMEGVLWPWCYTDKSNPHTKEFRFLASSAAAAMGMDYFHQSNHHYHSRGEFIDYAYMNHNVLALTFEVAQVPSPLAANLPQLAKRAVKGSMALMEALMVLDNPAVKIQRELAKRP